MIQAGEATGNIDEIMLRMATHFEKSNKTNNQVKSAMIYPIALCIVSVVVIIAMMLFVLPVFVELFSAEEMELPAITKFVMGFSNFINKYIIIILIILIGGIIGFNIYRKTEKGKFNLSKLYLKLPVIEDLNRKIIVARFTRTMSTLLSSGISLIEAIPIVSDVLVNKIAQLEMLRIRERVVRGDGLSGPISESEIFPILLSSMVKIGEESGSLDDILNKTADFYEEEVDQAIKMATGLMSQIMIVILGGIIGTVVIAIMLPMFNMYADM
jgi:type IV pilus assembly protein PilC